MEKCIVSDLLACYVSAMAIQLKQMYGNCTGQNPGSFETYVHRTLIKMKNENILCQEVL